MMMMMMLLPILVVTISSVLGSLAIPARGDIPAHPETEVTMRKFANYFYLLDKSRIEFIKQIYALVRNDCSPFLTKMRKIFTDGDHEAIHDTVVEFGDLLEAEAENYPGVVKENIRTKVKLMLAEAADCHQSLAKSSVVLNYLLKIIFLHLTQRKFSPKIIKYISNYLAFIKQKSSMVVEPLDPAIMSTFEKINGILKIWAVEILPFHQKTVYKILLGLSIIVSGSLFVCSVVYLKPKSKNN